MYILNKKELVAHKKKKESYAKPQIIRKLRFEKKRYVLINQLLKINVKLQYFIVYIFNFLFVQGRENSNGNTLEHVEWSIIYNYVHICILKISREELLIGNALITRRKVVGIDWRQSPLYLA